MATRICVISPTTRVAPDVAEAFAALWPEAELGQIVDDTVYQDVLGKKLGFTPEIKARVLSLLRQGEAAGGRAMMFTGSIFGALIEELRGHVSVPVVTSSQGLIEEAFAAGRRFGVVSTVAASIAVSPPPITASGVAPVLDRFVRAATVGTHPSYVEMIRELILERMGDAPVRHAIGRFGPNHDVCPEDCCLSGRAERRAPL